MTDQAAPPAATQTPADAIASKNLIIAMATRALRRVHLEYQLFGLGYQGDDPSDYHRLNHSAGVETAHEVAVAAAFVQEFHSSKLAHGWLESLDRAQASSGPAPKARRYFRIEHEHYYERNNPANTGYLDCVIWRVNDTGEPWWLDTVNGNTKRPWGIVPIEMKRADIFRKELPTGDRSTRQSNRAGVIADIEKLDAFAKAWRAGKSAEPKVRQHPLDRHEDSADVFPHVLVWGVCNNKEEPNSAAKAFLKDAFEQAGKKLDPGYATFECLPLSWESGKDIAWMWVAYAEIRT